MIERRKRHRDATSPHYSGFTDRRQPPGVAVTWDRTTGGELIRTRRDLAHLARVLVAKRGRSPDADAELAGGVGSVELLPAPLWPGWLVERPDDPHGTLWPTTYSVTIGGTP